MGFRVMGLAFRFECRQLMVEARLCCKCCLASVLWLAGDARRVWK